MQLNKEDYEGCKKAIEAGTAYYRQTGQTIGGVHSRVKCYFSPYFKRWTLSVPTYSFENAVIHFADVAEFKKKVWC